MNAIKSLLSIEATRKRVKETSLIIRSHIAFLTFFRYDKVRLGELTMLMTSDWVFILDEVDELSAMILSSQAAQNLRQAYKAVYEDAELSIQIKTFQRLKDQYEDVQRFGKYHPDYNTIMKKIRTEKRQLDLVINLFG